MAPRWSIGASVGAYLPSSALIRRAGASDTRLGSGPALTLEARYRLRHRVTAYGGWVLARGTAHLGSSIQTDPTGSTDPVLLGIGTAGLMVSDLPPLGGVRPTLRLGVGLKGYGFDFSDGEGQVRPTADVGVGIQSRQGGHLALSAEVRWLPSTLDQAQLPTRGIVPQVQRQNDFMLSVGLTVRR